MASTIAKYTTHGVNIAVDEKSDKELKRFVVFHLGLTFLVLLGLFVGLGLVSMKYQSELLLATQWLAEKFGFWGLATILFVSDTLLSPFPPDLVLVVIANSALRENWLIYILILGALSTCGGALGWQIGRLLIRVPWIKVVLPYQQILARQKHIQRFGLWAVALGAITPLPFSATCWTAGFLNIRFRSVVIASTLRFPRYFLYYLAISQSPLLKGLV